MSKVHMVAVASIVIVSLVIPGPIYAAPSGIKVDCTKTSLLTHGETAPCSGMLWSIPQTRQALLCQRRDFPKCKADYSLLSETSEIKIMTLSTQLATAEQQLKSRGHSGYVLLSVSAVSVTLGVIVGFFLFNQQGD